MSAFIRRGRRVGTQNSTNVRDAGDIERVFAGRANSGWRFAPLLQLAAIALLALTICDSHLAIAQGSVIRRARDAVREKTLSIDALFGKEPAITTSIEDARDGVPALDGFEPTAYAPLAEMPFGQDGTMLLVPGTYDMMSQGYCLKAGTFGPQTGDGYLHTEWMGPKADLVKRVLQRHVEQRDIPQRQVQYILWAIILRADPAKLAPETQAAARKLLTNAELLDLASNKLGVVPDEIRDRVLQSAPAPVREVLSAENETRRLLTSGEVRYADVERSAVLSGAIPPGDATFIIPKGRWSYHPAGFFIRYLPQGYTNLRIDVYYPQTFEIHRDASGRIISVTTPDGRKAEPNDAAVFLRFASSPTTAVASRPTLIRDAMHTASSNARESLVRLAWRDYEDLLDLAKTIDRYGHSHVDASGGTRALIREATHAALARYLGLQRLPMLTRGSTLEQRLRPVRTAHGYRYLIAPVAWGVSTMVQQSGGGTGYQPSSGGGTPTGPRQRLGASGLPSATASGASSPGNNPPSLGSAINGLSAAAGGLQLGSAISFAMNMGSPAYDPGFVGFNSPFDDASDDRAAGPGGDASDIRLATYQASANREFPAVRVRQGTPSYQTFTTPRPIEFSPVVPDAHTSPAQAKAWSATLDATLKLAVLVRATWAAHHRLDAAAKAHDKEWQFKQGRAIVYLKRASGLAMVELAQDLEALRLTGGPSLGITESDVRQGQATLAARGLSPEVIAIGQQLGVTEAEREAYRTKVLAADPAKAASELPAVLQNLHDSLLEYGRYLATMPAVKPPWE